MIDEKRRPQHVHRFDDTLAPIMAQEEFSLEAGEGKGRLWKVECAGHPLDVQPRTEGCGYSNQPEEAQFAWPQHSASALVTQSVGLPFQASAEGLTSGRQVDEFQQWPTLKSMPHFSKIKPATDLSYLTLTQPVEYETRDDSIESQFDFLKAEILVEQVGSLPVILPNRYEEAGS